MSERLIYTRRNAYRQTVPIVLSWPIAEHMIRSLQNGVTHCSPMDEVTTLA